MEKCNVKRIAREWKAMSHVVLSSKRLSLQYIQSVLEDTYQILREFHQDSNIPKEFCELFVAVDEFIYFLSITRDDHSEIDTGHYQAIVSIAEALKEGFINGKYEYDYPKLKIFGIDKETIIDFDSDVFS